MALVEWHTAVLRVVQSQVRTATAILIVDVDESHSTDEFTAAVRLLFPTATLDLTDETRTGKPLIEDPNIWGSKDDYDLIIFMSCCMAGLRGKEYAELYGMIKDRLRADGVAVMAGPGLDSGMEIQNRCGLRVDFYEVWGICHTGVGRWP
jgi:hypothetical protein